MGGELEAYKINSFVSFCFRFAGGNKNFIQKKRRKCTTVNLRNYAFVFHRFNIYHNFLNDQSYF